MSIHLFNTVLAMAGSEGARRRLEKFDESLDAASNTTDSRSNVQRRIEDLKNAFGVAGAVLAIGTTLALLSNQFAVFRLSGGVLGGVSAAFFAVAGISRLSGPEQSYKGKSSVEVADRHLFNLLCTLGWFFAVLAAI